MGAEGLRLVFMPPAEITAAAIACEAEVFHERYRISPARMAEDYGPYDDASAWVTVLAGTEVIAGARLVRPNPRGLKSLQDVSRPPWAVDPERVARVAGLDPQRTWDVATLFRRPGRPAAPVTAAVCHGIVMAMQENGANAAVAILDAIVRAMLLRAFGLRFHTLPGTSRQMFMNSPNDPTYVFLADLLDNSRRVNPQGYRMYAHGAGIEGILLPTRAEFRIPTRVVDVRETAAVPVQPSGREDIPRAS